MLCDDPNLFIDFWSSTHRLWNKLLTNANQLLCRKYQRRFFFEELKWLSIMCQARKKIKFHRCSFRNINVKQAPADFVKYPNLFGFFFVISKVCWTVCVFRFLNLGSLKRIYASLFTSRDFRHRRAVMLKVERNIKTRENRGKELYNVRMHFSPICCQKCERQCSNNDLLLA